MTAILSLSFLPSLFALEIPPQPEGRVSDYAGMLSPEARARLEETLRQFETETTNQVVVATFPSLEGEVLEDFSIRLAEQWKIGQAGKDNGVLLIFKNDRAVRIEVGYGLEGALPDATCQLIIENEIAPRFREGKFDEGVGAVVQAIISLLEPSPSAITNSVIGVSLGAGVVSLGVIFLYFFLRGRNRLHKRRKKQGVSRKRRRNREDNEETVSYTQSSDSRDSDDDRESFSGGGGSFGGGGASGGW